MFSISRCIYNFLYECSFDNKLFTFDCMNVKTANHIVSLFIFNEFQLQLIIDKNFYYRNLNRTEATIRGMMIYFRGLLKNSAYSRCWGYPFSETLSTWNSIETFTIPDFPIVFFFKQKTAYEMLRSLVGSEMCIRDS